MEGGRFQSCIAENKEKGRPLPDGPLPTNAVFQLNRSQQLRPFQTGI